jgi:peptidyl-prolyl cis-trans isomerase B (cyclophilin B)
LNQYKDLAMKTIHRPKVLIQAKSILIFRHMKKKRKNPLLSSGILLIFSTTLVLLSVYVLKPQFQKDKEQKDSSSLLWKNAKRDKITELFISTIDQSFTLKRKDDSKSWSLETNGKNFDADTSSVDSLISGLLSTKKEDSVQIDSTRSGLQAPVVRIKVTYKDEKNQKNESEILIGEDSPVDYQSYAQWANEKTPFMVSKTLKSVTNKKAADFRNKKVFNSNLADLKSITVKGKNPFSLVLGEGGKWFIKSGKRNLLADTGLVSDWLNTLQGIKVISFVEDTKNKKILDKYGLSQSAHQITFETLKNEKIDWLVSQQKIKKDNKTYAVTSTHETLYEMPSSLMSEFSKDYSDLRKKTLITLEKDKIQRIKYFSKDLQIELQKEASNWKGTHTLRGQKSQGTCKPDAVQKMINALSLIKADKFIEKSPRDPSLGIGKVKIEITEAPNKTVSLEIGDKNLQNSFPIWETSFEDPILSSLNFEELFSVNPDILLDKKELDKSPSPGASSSQGQRKIMKLEKSVNSVSELKKLPAPIVEKGAKYTVVFNFKNGRKLKGEFDSDKAPYTVSNFIHLARNHFYDGTVFHRVIRDFVLQGGDPTGSGRGGPGWMFDNEDNDLKHLRGSLSMAHAGRNTNGSQFFIVLQPQPHLDGVHTVFGKITEGLNELDLVKQGDQLATVEIFQEK